MAHAGTTSTSSGQLGLWKALLAAVVIAAIGIGIVLAVPFITGGRAITAPAADRGYDQIEAQRGATTLSGASVDTSYTSVENLRAQSGVTVDTSNAVQKAAAAKARAMSGVPAIDPTTFDRTPRGAHGMLP
jgi:hypothetical protein